jgi:hypothetical protein
MTKISLSKEIAAFNAAYGGPWALSSARTRTEGMSAYVNMCFKRCRIAALIRQLPPQQQLHPRIEVLRRELDRGVSAFHAALSSFNLGLYYEMADAALARKEAQTHYLVFKGGELALEPRAASGRVRGVFTSYKKLSSEEQRINQRVSARFLDLFSQSLVPKKWEQIRNDHKGLITSLRKGHPLLPVQVHALYCAAQKVLTCELTGLIGKDMRSISDADVEAYIVSEMPVRYEALDARPSVPGSLWATQRVECDAHQALRLAYEEVVHIHPLSAGELKGIQDDKGFWSSRFAVWLEMCCRKTVSLELREGLLIPAPNPDSSGVGFYEVYKKVAGKGLIAYALRPVAADSKLPPCVIFRSTQWRLGAEAALDSLRNDLDSELGQRGWFACRDQLKALMRDPSFIPEGQRALISGYSLGGVHAQLFTAECSEWVERLVTYNAPGVSERVAEAFAARVNTRDPLQLLCIQIVRTEGDVCHHIGDRHLGHGVESGRGVEAQLLSFPYTGEKMRMGRHRVQIIREVDAPRSFVEATAATVLEQELDNAKRSKPMEGYRRVHRSCGFLARGFLEVLEKICLFIQWLWSCPLLRS